MSAGRQSYAFSELTCSKAFPGRDDPKHPERAGRGWGRQTTYDEHGHVVSSEVWGGYLEFQRADKYSLDRRVSLLCKSIIEHIIGETSSSPYKDEFAHITDEDLELMTGRKRRAIQIAVKEGENAGKTTVLPGIIERENPDDRYGRGGYKVNLHRIQAVPFRPERFKTITVSQRAPRAQAALRGAASKDRWGLIDQLTASDDPQECAQQLALLERKIAEIRGKANSCPPERQQSSAQADMHQTSAPAGAQSPAAGAHAVAVPADAQTTTDAPSKFAGEEPAQSDDTARGAKHPAVLAQITLARATSSDAPGALPCPECGSYLYVLEATNQEASSSSASTSRRTAGKEDDEAQHLAILQTEIQEHDSMAGETHVRRIWDACRTITPDITGEEAAELCKVQMSREAELKKRIVSPANYLTTVIPQSLPGALQKLRQKRSVEQKRGRRQAAEEEHRILCVEYEQFRNGAAEAAREALSPGELERRRAEKRARLKAEGRLEKIHPDVRENEIDSLVFIDLEHEVMPFDEWEKTRGVP